MESAPGGENNIEINLASAIPAPDGTVWFSNKQKAYQVDPRTGEMTTYKMTAPEAMDPTSALKEFSTSRI